MTRFCCQFRRLTISDLCFNWRHNSRRFLILSISIIVIWFHCYDNNKCQSPILNMRRLFSARSLDAKRISNHHEIIKLNNVQPDDFSERNEYSPRQQTENQVRIKHANYLLVIVTTWVPSEEKRFVHDNVARLWGFWPQLVQPILYILIHQNNENSSNPTDNDVNNLIRNGWIIRQVPQVLCGDVPVLKSMILDAMMLYPKASFYGFANSDIIFDSGLIKTLYAADRLVPKSLPILLLGQRTNFNVTQEVKFSNPDSVRHTSKKGVLMKGIAIDYFITNSHFPWHEVPNLVIGRIIYDNWMIYYGISSGSIVIDASKTIVALHQTTADGNAAGWRYSHRYCNKFIIDNLKKPFQRRWGYTWCVPHKSLWRNNTDIIELKTVSVSRSCYPKHPSLIFPKG